MLLRNPWGNGKEWKGAWSDGSKEWKENPPLAKELDYAPAPDGLFWMEWGDFHQKFDHVNVCPKDMRVAGEKTKLGLRQYPSWHKKGPSEDTTKVVLFGMLALATALLAAHLSRPSDGGPDVD